MNRPQFCKYATRRAIDAAVRAMTARDMEKVAVRLPVIHGTSGAWEKLLPGVGATIARSDPNPRAVYMAMRNRRTQRPVEGFARAAATARGGVPHVAHAKIDTTEGWIPHGLTQWARDRGLTMQDFQDAIEDLDAGIQGDRRGELWEQLQRGVGAWKNRDATVTVRPDFYRVVGG